LAVNDCSNVQGTVPARWARVAGAMYLFIVATGVIVEVFVRSRLVIGTDAAATAANITRDPLLLRIGFSAELLMWVFDIALAVILYMLLRPAGHVLAAIMASLRLATASILAVNALFQFVALMLLGDALYLEPLAAAQREAIALLSMKLHGIGYGVALVFFGFHCLLLGMLVVRATCLPNWLGVLLAIAGACYLINSFSLFLAPTLASAMFPAILVPAFIAELAFSLWLLIRGVDTRQR
jgi:hypothetical protein